MNATTLPMAEIEEMIEAYLDENRMFTAYEITVETRKRNGLFLKHTEVRDHIHEVPSLEEAMENGWMNDKNMLTIWRRSEVSMPNGTWAWVYHPTSVDPQNYVPFASPAPVKKPSSISLVSSTPAPAAKKNDDEYVLDRRHRLLVPTHFLSDLGVGPGDLVYVVPGSGFEPVMIFPQKDDVPESAFCYTQVVERNGHVRVSSRTIKADALKTERFLIETTKRQHKSRLVKVVEIKPVR